MRTRLGKFESLPPESQLKHIYERAGFYHPVQRQNYYNTRADDDDGWGKITPMCREYIHLRSHSKSRCMAVIPGGSVIGPVSLEHASDKIA